MNGSEKAAKAASLHAPFRLHGCSIVSCGTLRRELGALRDAGSLEVDRILYTAPGLHERPEELETQLTKQLRRARAISAQVIVVYGSRCYVDMSDPERTIDTLIEQVGDNVVRVDALNCVDMLAGAEQREVIQGDDRVYWLTPGWVEHWKRIFRDWDAGMANETFPQNDRAVVLDGLGRFEELALNRPEHVLEFADWMKTPMEPYAISLERLRDLLKAASKELLQRRAGPDPTPDTRQEPAGQLWALRARVDRLEIELAQTVASRPAHDRAGLSAMRLLQLEEDLEEARRALTQALAFLRRGGTSGRLRVGAIGHRGHKRHSERGG